MVELRSEDKVPTEDQPDALPDLDSFAFVQDDSEDWLITYLDVLTLLIVFMVLMISNADFRQNLVEAIDLERSRQTTSETVSQADEKKRYELYLSSFQDDGFIYLDFRLFCVVIAF